MMLYLEVLRGRQDYTVVDRLPLSNRWHNDAILFLRLFYSRSCQETVASERNVREYIGLEADASATQLRQQHDSRQWGETREDSLVPDVAVHLLVVLVRLRNNGFASNL